MEVPSPVETPSGTSVVQLLPEMGTVTVTLELLLPHVLLAAEKAGNKPAALGTLHATWPSAVGFAAAVKLQMRPLLQGRGPVTR